MDFQGALVAEDYYKVLEDLLKAKNRHQLEQAVVNAPFQDRRVAGILGLGIIVLLLVNKKEGTIERIAVSDNDLTQGTFQMSAIPFKEIKIPRTYTKNFIARAIKERHYMITSDWQYLFNPALTPEQARFNQAGGGIACSVVYPLNSVFDGGAMIFSYYEPIERISKGHHNFMARYTSIVQKAFQNLLNE